MFKDAGIARPGARAASWSSTGRMSSSSPAASSGPTAPLRRHLRRDARVSDPCPLGRPHQQGPRSKRPAPSSTDAATASFIGNGCEAHGGNPLTRCRKTVLRRTYGLELGGVRAPMPNLACEDEKSGSRRHRAITPRPPSQNCNPCSRETRPLSSVSFLRGEGRRCFWFYHNTKTEKTSSTLRYAGTPGPLSRGFHENLDNRH